MPKPFTVLEELYLNTFHSATDFSARNDQNGVERVELFFISRKNTRITLEYLIDNYLG